jgi:hypothetical protein
MPLSSVNLPWFPPYAATMRSGAEVVDIDGVLQVWPHGVERGANPGDVAFGIPRVVPLLENEEIGSRRPGTDSEPALVKGPPELM